MVVLFFFIKESSYCGVGANKLPLKTPVFFLAFFRITSISTIIDRNKRFVLKGKRGRKGKLFNKKVDATG